MALDIGDWLSGTKAIKDSPCGLFTAGGSSVPLRLRHVSSIVYADAGFAETTETFSYVCDEDYTAIFKFPLPPKAAVYKYVVTCTMRCWRPSSCA